jgi:hypothetical protein
MTAVATMSVMHEHMHERTGEERKPYQGPKDVRTVLGKEQRTTDDKEYKHDEPCPRCQKAPLPLPLMLRVIVHRHRVLLFDN